MEKFKILLVDDVVENIYSLKMMIEYSFDVEIIGERFGSLVCLDFYENDDSGNKKYLCACDCGKQTIGYRSDLLQGKKRSCGCGQGNRSHGLSMVNGKKTRLYHIWISMRQRCENSNDKAFNDYGGRGIKVCGLWRDYDPFHVRTHQLIV